MLALRPATEKDAQAFYDLRNEDEVRRRSFQQDDVQWVDHLEWLDRKLASPDSTLFVVELDGAWAGQVRVDRIDERQAEISIALAAAARGRGVAGAALAEASARATDELGVDVIVARIKEDNVPSLRAFASAGYVLGDACEGVLTLAWRADRDRQRR